MDMSIGKMMLDIACEEFIKELIDHGVPFDRLSIQHPYDKPLEFWLCLDGKPIQQFRLVLKKQEGSYDEED